VRRLFPAASAGELLGIGVLDHVLIASEVYDAMNEIAKSYNGSNMWERVTWTTTGREIYRSTWWLSP
jgi:hypothetical protein